MTNNPYARRAGIHFTLSALALADDPTEIADVLADIYEEAAMEAGKKQNPDKKAAFARASIDTRKVAEYLRDANVTSLRTRRIS